MSPSLRKLKRIGLVSLFGVSVWTAVASRASAVQWIQVHTLYDKDDHLLHWAMYLVNPPQTANLLFQIFSLAVTLGLIVLPLAHTRLYGQAVKEGDTEHQETARLLLFVSWLVDFCLFVEIGFSVHQLAIHWHTSPHPFWIFPTIKLILFGCFLPIILWRVRRKFQRQSKA